MSDTNPVESNNVTNSTNAGSSGKNGLPKVILCRVGRQLQLQQRAGWSVNNKRTRPQLRRIVSDFEIARRSGEQVFLPGRGLIDCQSCSDQEVAEFLTYTIATTCGVVVDLRVHTSRSKPPAAPATESRVGR
ncbi:MAG: hypothetical protein ACKO2L_22450 [Planctomycetaceae bacterium]